jgi:hypothetical protein
MSNNGKGSKRRPQQVDRKTFENNWNRIFKRGKNVNSRQFKNK